MFDIGMRDQLRFEQVEEILSILVELQTSFGKRSPSSLLRELFAFNSDKFLSEKGSTREAPESSNRPMAAIISPNRFNSSTHEQREFFCVHLKKGSMTKSRLKKKRMKNITKKKIKKKEKDKEKDKDKDKEKGSELNVIQSSDKETNESKKEEVNGEYILPNPPPLPQDVITLEQFVHWCEFYEWKHMSAGNGLLSWLVYDLSNLLDCQLQAKAKLKSAAKEWQNTHHYIWNEDISHFSNQISSFFQRELGLRSNDEVSIFDSLSLPSKQSPLAIATVHSDITRDHIAFNLCGDIYHASVLTHCYHFSIWQVARLFNGWFNNLSICQYNNGQYLTYPQFAQVFDEFWKKERFNSSLKKFIFSGLDGNRNKKVEFKDFIFASAVIFGKAEQTIDYAHMLFNSFESNYDNALSENDVTNYLSTACDLFGSEQAYKLTEDISTTNVEMTKLSELANQIAQTFGSKLTLKKNKKKQTFPNQIRFNLYVQTHINILKKRNEHGELTMNVSQFVRYLEHLHKNECKQQCKKYLDLLFESIAQFTMVVLGLHPPHASYERAVITQLLADHYDVVDSLEFPAFEEYGDVYYLIHKPWWDVWATALDLEFVSLFFLYKTRSDGRVNVVSQRDTHDPEQLPLDASLPGMIDNTSLVGGFKDVFQFRTGLEANRDYVAVPPVVWNTLSQWYGGGPALMANIVGVSVTGPSLSAKVGAETEAEAGVSNGSDKTDDTLQYISYLEIYPLRIHIHTKTNPIVFDHARSRMEQMKMEEDFKAFSDENEKARQKEEELELEMKDEKKEEKKDDGQQEMLVDAIPTLMRSMSWFESYQKQQNKEKIVHVDNGMYYQWDLLFSQHTSMAYIVEILARYDHIVRAAVVNNAPLQMQHLRLWDLKGRKELVVKQHQGGLLQISTESLAYSALMGDNQWCCGQALCGAKQKKKDTPEQNNPGSSLNPNSSSDPNKTASNDNNTNIANSRPSSSSSNEQKDKESQHTAHSILLLNEVTTLQQAKIEINGYLYLEVTEANGKWTGVQGLHSTLNQADHYENNNEQEKIEIHIDVKVEETTSTTDPAISKDKSIAQVNSSQSLTTEDIQKLNLSFGIIGLRNMGNTCYLNAALQCLSHTTPLTEYFLSKVFINELNKFKKFDDDPDYWRVPLAVGALFNQMWSSQSFSTHMPRNVKTAVTLVNPLFEGHEQHDSQEALQALLTGIHEGLNRVKVSFEKPYVPIEDSNGRPDETVAKEHWECHMQREQSVIVNLCEGQYKNTLKCNECGRVNNKFEPYQMLSLPIPEISDIFLNVIVHYYHPYRKPVRYNFRLTQNTNIRGVVRRVSHLTGIAPHLLVPAHIVSNAIRQFISLDKSVQGIQLHDIVVLLRANILLHFICLYQHGVQSAPLGIRPGGHFDVYDHSNTWCEVEVLDMKLFEDVYNHYIDEHPNEAKQCNCVRLQPFKKQMSATTQNENRLQDEASASTIADPAQTKTRSDFLKAVLGPSSTQQQSPSNTDEKTPSKEKVSTDVKTTDELRGKWMIRIHYLNTDAQSDEWIPYDSPRIQVLGTKVKSVSPQHKYQLAQIDIPYHVLPLRCIHRRVVPQRNWFIRESEPHPFGLPVMLFLPKKGFTANDLYHMIWNLIQFRYLNGIQIKTSNETVSKKSGQSRPPGQKASDLFNSLANSYYYIFGNLMQETNKKRTNAVNSKETTLCPSRVWWTDGCAQTELPFVLKRVDMLGKKCYRCTWDKYCSGCIIPYCLHTTINSIQPIESTSSDEKTEANNRDEHMELLEFDEQKEYLAIDWDESFFKCFLQSRIEKEIVDAGMDVDEIVTAVNTKTNASSSSNNSSQNAVQKNDTKTNQSNQRDIFQKQMREYSNWNTQFSHHTQLVFENVLEHSSVQEHIHIVNKPISIGDCIREYQKEEKQPDHNGGKIDTNVEYLLKYFDMEPFVVPRKKGLPKQKEEKEKTEEKQTNEAYPDTLNVNDENNVPTTYHLFGVVHHYGRSGGGHYVANCLCRDLTHPNSTIKKWYLFDDHRVRQISSLDVKAKTAYLLFYLRSDYCEKDRELMEYFVHQTKEGSASGPFNKSKEVMDILSYLPAQIKQMVGEELSEEQKKLFESEGVKNMSFMDSCVIM
ncbi:ubiquitin specific peptidase 15 [Reticulomyxa filosa]|uniref:Ubiquitin specific peptidase 15 n=1 Tax=Reticulomyxa filosa TaxID=46433 RepID=X6LZM5_RETFI|nr:ubiquitin specific peptidase 15 [Reticulomyxa filosa]|eukprot:ETO06801.1 ubiquitin specific peptidase 15 [Reticulomyxa filosa]